jgi:hypothetical protein
VYEGSLPPDGGLREKTCRGATTPNLMGVARERGEEVGVGPGRRGIGIGDGGGEGGGHLYARLGAVGRVSGGGGGQTGWLEG